MGLLKCPRGCGWEGPATEYSKHYNECPAKVCPKCGSPNIFFYQTDAIECLTCGNKWSRKKLPVERSAEPPTQVEEEKTAPKIFKTEEEFQTWLEKQGVTAEPKPHTGLYKDDKRVGSYFETSEGIQVNLTKDAETWLIRDKTYAKVEAEEEVTVEEPLQTPIEATEETSEEKS